MYCNLMNNFNICNQTTYQYIAYNLILRNDHDINILYDIRHHSKIYSGLSHTVNRTSSQSIVGMEF